jgi:hypothetical protein
MASNQSIARLALIQTDVPSMQHLESVTNAAHCGPAIAEPDHHIELTPWDGAF